MLDGRIAYAGKYSAPEDVYKRQVQTVDALQRIVGAAGGGQQGVPCPQPVRAASTAPGVRATPVSYTHLPAGRDRRHGGHEHPARDRIHPDFYAGIR